VRTAIEQAMVLAVIVIVVHGVGVVCG
jgi:hypothetical protein